ncbi:MAG: AbrB family transcriptional regulator, partial [Negativicutes bacterium]|nr:AbrB family transcriptional regulator [Negativicutes bacterium]
ATAGLAWAGVEPPLLPPAILSLAQICVSVPMGMAITPETLKQGKRLFIAGLLGMIGVILSLLAICYFWAKTGTISFVTAFISVAPGGMTEMGLTALMVHADLPTVIAFQMFRVLFVLLVAIPVARRLICCRNGQEDAV